MGIDERHDTGSGNAKIVGPFGRRNRSSPGRHVLSPVQKSPEAIRLADDGGCYHRFGHARSHRNVHRTLLAQQ